MSEEWIKMRTNLGHEPEVIQMAEMLDLDIDTVVGKLHRLWSWADQTCANGCAVGVTFVRVNWLVRQKNFAESLEAVGWLRATESGIQFPKYDRHMSKNAKKRALARRRMAMHRLRERDATSDAPSVTKTSLEQEQEVIPPKSPSADARGTDGFASIEDEDEKSRLVVVEAYWKTKYPDCHLGDADRERITGRLRDGFKVAQLTAAIDASPFMSIRKMFRDAGSVNAILNPPPAEKSPSTNDTQRLSEQERGKFIRWALKQGKSREWIEATAKQRWPDSSEADTLET